MDLKRLILQACWQGLVRLIILQEACKGPIYGVRLKKLLSRHGYAISSGSLYPMLHQLEAGGALRSRIRIFRGRARKYYELTPKGRSCCRTSRPLSPPPWLSWQTAPPRPPPSSPCPPTWTDRPPPGAPLPLSSRIPACRHLFGVDPLCAGAFRALSPLPRF